MTDQELLAARAEVASLWYRKNLSKMEDRRLSELNRQVNVESDRRYHAFRRRNNGGKVRLIRDLYWMLTRMPPEAIANLSVSTMADLRDYVVSCNCPDSPLRRLILGETIPEMITGRHLLAVDVNPSMN